MPSVNKVILIGNLTRDPEIRQANNGSMIASFTLAMSRRFTSQQRQEPVEEVCFVDVTAFQRNAETIQKYVHKGDPLFVEGRLHYDTWDDKTTGAKRNRLTVICEALQLLARRDPSAMGGATPYPSQGSMTVGGQPMQQNYRPQPAYGQPQVPQQGYVPQPPPAYRPASSAMPSFQPPVPEPPAPTQDAPVDDLPF